METIVRYAKCLGTAVALFTLGWGSACAEVVAVVSAKSPLAMLTRSQVGDIFLGKVNRLPDGTTVVPIDQAEGSPVRDEFYAAVSSKSAAQIKAYWSKIIFTGRGTPPRAVNNDNEAKKFVEANPNAIAYIEKNAVDTNVKVLQIAP